MFGCYAIDIVCLYRFFLFFFFKQKTAYEMRISDWSSDVCSSDLAGQEAEAVVIDHDQHAVPLDHRAFGGEIERHDGDVLGQNVVPHVELGPIREREHKIGRASL